MRLPLASSVGLLALGGAALAFAAPARPARPPAPALTAAEKTAATRITPAALLGPIRFLSDDLLEGRGTASRGEALARAYIASEMQAAGLRPGAADGTYFQTVAALGITTKVPRKVAFRGPRGKRVVLDSATELAVASGVQTPRAALTNAELVFVGYGIVAPEHGWNDYAGVDVKGKVAVIMNDDPSRDPSKFGGATRLWYGRWDYKYLEAARQGAAGAIIIHTDASAGYPFSVIQPRGEEFELPAGDEPRLAIKMWSTEAATRRLFALGGHDLDALRAAAEQRPFTATPLGVKVSLAIGNKVRPVETANVLGLLPGSDPTLRQQAVVFTAHHDHLGVGPADDDGDRIHNGAVDNASGVSALLAIARAAAAGPAPRRSLLFITTAAEEQGLLGSGYYARNPTFAPGRIAANLNIDSLNVLGRTRDLQFIGHGKSSLDRVVEAVAATQGRRVTGDATPEDGSFYRSDQFNFARIGVPAIYASGGLDYVGRPAGWGKAQRERYVAERYHAPSDEYDPSSWDLAGAVEDTRLLLIVALRIANAPTMPTWNPGDEFEAARKAALSAAR